VALQRRLQHEFSDPALLTQALTHRSFSGRPLRAAGVSGRSVLNLAVSDLLFRS
jgi:ribonuclease-3